MLLVMHVLCRNQRAALSFINLQLIPVTNGLEDESRKSMLTYCHASDYSGILCWGWFFHCPDRLSIV